MQNKKKLTFYFILILATSVMHAKSWFDILPIADVVKQNVNVTYQKCFDEINFEYQPFPLLINQEIHPNKGFFKETFILHILNATVQNYGLVLVGNIFIEELIWKNFRHNLAHVRWYNRNKIVRVPYKVAVVGQAACHNYFHWLTEILCRLALLEMQGVAYDYLYVPCDLHFMQESLALWGIDFSKIIPAHPNLCVQADTVIVPSLVSNVSFGGVLGACYVQMHLLNYVKQKLLTAALQHQPSVKLAPKVFISRKDAPQRKVINEDEVFSLFEQQGFVRYELDKLSVVDQILLFHHAQVVVSPQGTGLANTIFCKKGTKIIELLQGLNDCTFWYLSQDLGLDYTAVPTTNFLQNYYDAWATNTSMDLVVIKKLLENF